MMRHGGTRHLLLAITLLVLAFAAGRSAAQVPANLMASTGRDCAICHLDWVDSFKQPKGVVLMEQPKSPAAATSETCLGCHDGSVGDSRRQVYLDHGHRTGIAPTRGMKVPADLPLEDGKMTCRTCHTAHSEAGAQSLKDMVFLRMKNDQGQMCKACHADYAAGPASGSHPVGPMVAALPEKLREAGSHAGADQKQVVCQTCHTAHGAKADHLLVLSTDSNQLCVSCHEKMRPAMWQDNAAHQHPQNPPLRRESHLKAIKDMGTKVGDSNTLICLSCHKIHHGQEGRAMLADTLQDSRMCIRCHEDRAAMAGSSHDLRKSAPGEKNARKETPQQSGPCGSCHTFHNYAREMTPRNGDPQGVCTTCHDEAKVAAKHTGQPFSHPGEIDQARIPKDAKLALYPSKDDPKKKAVACLSCHDPHQTKQSHYLRSTGDDLCASCHGEKTHMAGPHDFSRSDLRNAKGRSGTETGKCGFCHAVHDAKGPAMWVATGNAPKTGDEFCAECHRGGGLGEKKPLASFNHPTGPGVRPTTRPGVTPLPLFNAQGHMTGEGFVTCASCHDLHAGNKASQNLLRTEGSPTSLCVQCHPDQGGMADSKHDVRKTQKAWPGSRTDDLCLGCHRPHSSDPDKKRWAVAPQNGTGGDAACAGCHPTSAWAGKNSPPKPGAMLHPQTISGLGTTHALPLGAGDSMTCSTCHNPHSPPGPQALLRIQPGKSADELCDTCHKDAAFIENSMHSRSFLHGEKDDGRACSPCHSPHATAGSTQKLMWSAKSFPSGRTPSEQLCLGCHSPGGDAKRPTMVQHPATSLQKVVANQSPELRAKVAAIDPITCSTCHLPHGRDMGPPPKDLSPAMARAQLSGIKPMLKPNVDRETCALCHGADAKRMYLYFHNPKKRAMVQKMVE